MNDCSAELSMPVARVNYESKPLTLRLNDFTNSTSTSPWIFQQYKRISPFSEDPNTKVAKTVTCVNLAKLGPDSANENCCNQKHIHMNAGSVPVSDLTKQQRQQNDLEVKLGEPQMNQRPPEPSLGEGTHRSGEGRPTNRTGNSTTNWIWPEHDDNDDPLSKIVPRIGGTTQHVVGNPLRKVVFVNGSGSADNSCEGFINSTSALMKPSAVCGQHYKCMYNDGPGTCVNKCNSMQSQSSCGAAYATHGAFCNYNATISTCVDQQKVLGPVQVDGVGSGAKFATIFSTSESW